MSGRGPAKSHVVRKLVTSNKTGDVYGITIPAVLVEQCNLLGKKFKIEITSSGYVIIHTKITKRDKKR